MMDSAKKPRVLVTGASGFIAGYCIEQLLAQGYRVRGTVRSLARPDRVAHLRALPGASDRTLELVEAELQRDAGWAEAVAGCAYVLHVASPFPSTRPKHESEIVTPAVEGTRRVLTACAADGGVKRVVMTSSLAAILYGHDSDDGRTFTEEDWSQAARCRPYEKSKTLAERAAWDFVAALPAAQRFELVAINPGFVLGPVQHRACGTSGELVRKLMAREVPACAALGWAMVDVRDVAAAHLLAMTTPGAAGQRFICAGPHTWMREVAQILAQELGPQGYKIPTGMLPNWLLWVVARFDGTVRMSLDYLGHQQRASSQRAMQELGWSMRPLRDTIVDTAHSMIEHGVVRARGGRSAA